jgi:Glyoxalase-like domain
MHTRIDHLVIGAANIAQGVSYIKEHLGIDIPFGGMHPKMGTHNHLVQLGNDMFLEVIAIDPNAQAPEKPRWFGLDDALIRQKIQNQPTLLTWVVNTRDINESMQKSELSFGKAELVTRGKLSWHMGLTDDGRLLAGGMLPYILQWHADSHPSVNMADLGCRLKSLQIYHPYPSWLLSSLESIGANDLVNVHALPAKRTPYLIANIDTPNGIIELASSHP